MKRYALRAAVAVLTFTVGFVAAGAWLLRRTPTAPTIPATVTGVLSESRPRYAEVPVPASSSPPLTRRITGYVRDREGRPVAGAEVCAQPHSGSAGRIPCAVSKAGGRFTLEVWQRGTYTVTAERLAEGYPEATNNFHGGLFGELPVIFAGESSSVTPVEVRVGPQAGRGIFRIVDDESGRPVTKGLVKACRTDSPQACMSMSREFPRGRHEMLAPEVPFTVRFEVWGKDWERREAMGVDGAPVELLEVGLGGRKEVKVRLRRVSDER